MSCRYACVRRLLVRVSCRHACVRRLLVRVDSVRRVHRSSAPFSCDTRKNNQIVHHTALNTLLKSIALGPEVTPEERTITDPVPTDTRGLIRSPLISLPGIACLTQCLWCARVRLATAWVSRFGPPRRCRSVYDNDANSCRLSGRYRLARCLQRDDP